MDSINLIISTCPDIDQGEALAAELVQGGLAACVNLVPGARSFYLWEGQMQRDEEVLLLIKTGVANTPRLIEELARRHPYDVPEIIALPVTAGHTPYLEWVNQCVTS
jgi:periplasmic divalent cation tolerance protein